MSRLSRIFRIWMFLAVVVGAFSPLTQLELMAEDVATPAPEIEFVAVPVDDSQNPEMIDGEDQAPEQLESPDSIELILVMPEPPIVSECGDVSAIQLPSGPEGVKYTVVDLGEGTYIVEARIIDPTIHTWGEFADPWAVESAVATYPVTLEQCVEEESGPEAHVATPDDSAEEIVNANSEPEPIPDQGLSIAVEAEPSDTVQPGTDITYSVTISRLLTGEWIFIGFTIVLPAEVQYENYGIQLGYSGYGCDYLESAHSVRCEGMYGWEHGESRAFYIYVQVGEPDSTANCSGTLTADVEGWAEVENYPDYGWIENNTASVSNELDCQELSVELSPETQTIGHGDSFYLDLTISNPGPEVTGVDATIAVPEWPHIANLYTLIPDSNNCLLHGIEVACSNLTIPENGALTIPVEAIPYGRSATCGTYPLVATVSDESVAPATAELIIECSVDYEWTQAVSNASPAPGDELEYTLQFKNTGNTAFSLNIQDTLPELPGDSPWEVSVFPTLHSSTTCQGVVDQEDFTTTSNIDCHIYNAVPGASVTITATGIVPEASADLSMCGTHESNAMAVTIDPLRVNSEGGLDVISDLRQSNLPPVGESGITIECPGIEVAMHSDVLDGEATQPGDLIVYTVEVINTGNVEIDNYTLFNNLDWALTLDELTFIPDEADCDSLDGVYLDCAVANFAPNTTHAFVFTAIVNHDLTAEQCNTSIDSGALLYASQIPDDLQPMIASESTSLECTAGAQFEMSAVNQTVVPGDSIAYTVDLENSGTLVLNEINIETELPTLPEGGIWNVTIDGESVALPHTIEKLSPGGTVSILIESSPIPEDLTLPDSEWCDERGSSATLSGTFSNDEPAAASDNAEVRVNCTGISIEKLVSSELIEVGETVTYIIAITNHGNTVAHNVVVEDDVAETGLVFGNWRADSEACVIDDAITCEFDELAAGESLSITITADAPMVPTLEQCNPVESSAWFSYQTAAAPLVAPMSVDLTPPDTRINSNTITTRIDCQPALEISSVAELVPGENGRMDAGDTITYTVTIANPGNMTIYGASVSSETSVGFNWGEKDNTIDELAPGESVELTAKYEVTQADLDAGEVVQSLSASGELDPAVKSASNVENRSFGIVLVQVPALGEVNAEITVVTALEQVPAMGIEISADADDPSNVGDTVTYTFIITNASNVTLRDVAISITPGGLIWNSDPVVSTLTPGNSAEFTASYMVTEADAGVGEVVVFAEVTAVDQMGGAVSANDIVVIQVAEVTTSEPPLEVTPGTTPDATPPLDTSQMGDPTAESVTRLPETGTGNAIGVGQMMWVAIVLSALALAGTIGVQRRRS